jgi:hypothetical protein
VTTTTGNVPSDPPFILGDVNSDKKVNSVDASQILAEYAQTSTNRPSIFSDLQKKAGDVDENGRVNSVDASKVLAFYAYTSTGGNITDMREWLK